MKNAEIHVCLFTAQIPAGRGLEHLRPRKALSMLSEMPEHWLVRDGCSTQCWWYKYCCNCCFCFHPQSDSASSSHPSSCKSSNNNSSHYHRKNYYLYSAYYCQCYHCYCYRCQC